MIKENTVSGPVHIIASPFKTGTSSIGEAIKVLGVGSRLMPHDNALLRESKRMAKKAGRFIRKNQKFVNFHAAHAEQVIETLSDLVPKIAKYDIFHDAPIGHSHIHPFLLKTLMPQARFIWVHRPQDDWLESVRKWELAHPETYRRASMWHTDPEARAQEKTEIYAKRLTQFHRIRRACPDDVLELQWDDLGSFDKLAAFYDCPVPDRPFPAVNVAKT